MAKKKNGNGRTSLRLYRSYNFVDKDPAIDKIRTLMRDEGVSEREMHILSNVSQSTIHNWLEGKTRRPQHTTLAAAAAAVGYDWELTRKTRFDKAAELPKAVRWQERQEKLREQAK